MIIAIDGPSGAGKTTVARELARRFNLTHIDTGAMYRAVALACMRDGIGLEDPTRVEEVARSCSVTFVRPAVREGAGCHPVQRVLLNGVDVTEAIRDPEVTALASPVSAIPAVRQALVAQQRAMAAGLDVVMEGRDIGTVVLPHADLKVFLTASPEERARRRYLELRQRGVQVGFEEVLRDIQERDHRDSTRADSPLMRAEDAVLLETDGLDVDGVVNRIATLVEQRR